MYCLGHLLLFGGKLLLLLVDNKKRRRSLFYKLIKLISNTPPPNQPPILAAPLSLPPSALVLYSPAFDLLHSQCLSYWRHAETHARVDASTAVILQAAVPQKRHREWRLCATRKTVHLIDVPRSSRPTRHRVS